MKRPRAPGFLLAAGLAGALLSCRYEPLKLTGPFTRESTGILIVVEAGDPEVDTLQASWTGGLAAATPLPDIQYPVVDALPSGGWKETTSGAKRFDCLRCHGPDAGMTSGVTLYRDPELGRAEEGGSVLRPGLWEFELSLWEDGCPASVDCRQEIFGVFFPPLDDHPASTATLRVNRAGCSSPIGLASSHAVQVPLLEAAEAVAPIADYRTGARPCRWSEGWGAAGEWVVAVDTTTGRKGLTTASASGDLRLLAWDYVPLAGDVEVLARLRPGTDQPTGVCVRSAGTAASASGYCAAVLGGTTLQVYQYAGGVSSALAPSAPFVHGSGNHVWLRFRVEGSTFRAKAWPDDPLDPYLANEPGWMIPAGALGATPLGPGWVGVATSNAAAAPRYDWFSVGLRGATAPRPSPPALQAPLPAPRLGATPAAAARRQGVR